MLESDCSAETRSKMDIRTLRLLSLGYKDQEKLKEEL